MQEKEKSTFLKAFDFVKEYMALINIILISVLILFDYFIFTYLFHFKQANFFNNLLSFDLSSQFIIEFVLLPIALTSLFLLLFIILNRQLLLIPHDTIIKCSFKWCQKFDQKIFLCILIIVSLIFWILGDWLFYFIFNMIHLSSSEPFSLMASFLIIIIGFFLIDYIFLIGFIQLFILRKTKGFFRLVFVVLAIIKLAFYFSITIAPSLVFFSILNILFFSLTIFRYYEVHISGKEPTKITNQFLLTIFSSLVAILFLSQLQSVIGGLMTANYQEKSFWSKKVYEPSILNTNFSVILNSLKISIYNDVNRTNLYNEYQLFNTELQLKGANSDFNKTTTFIDIKKSQEIMNGFNILENNNKLAFFHIPSNEKELIFIHSTNDNDLNVSVLFMNKGKLQDIGYIELHK